MKKGGRLAITAHVLVYLAHRNATFDKAALASSELARTLPTSTLPSECPGVRNEAQEPNKVQGEGSKLPHHS